MVEILDINDWRTIDSCNRRNFRVNVVSLNADCIVRSKYSLVDWISHALEFYYLLPCGSFKYPSATASLIVRNLILKLVLPLLSFSEVGMATSCWIASYYWIKKALRQPESFIVGHSLENAADIINRCMLALRMGCSTFTAIKIVLSLTYTTFFYIKQWLSDASLTDIRHLT
jgi:hypothetical protein